MFHFDPATGWLLPGRHAATLANVWVTFAPNSADPTRRAIRLALEVLLNTARDLIPSGFLMISGTFVSQQPGPSEVPLVAVVPHIPDVPATWTDSQEDRFVQHLTRSDVIIGGGSQPKYLPLLQPISGALDVLFVEQEDAAFVEQVFGAVTMSDGSEVMGVRGVVEVVW